MKSLSVFFTAPKQVSVREEVLLPPASGQVLVQTLLSAISPGTELLLYRAEFPKDIPVDESISGLSGEFSYPIKYGYSAVGRVAALGSDVDPGWENQLVFSFQPHTSYFIVQAESLIPIPIGLSPENAVFLPNMETAINFVMDGKPMIGEQVVVFGQGIVGLLTTALLSRFPLAKLVTLDRYSLRRQVSLDLGSLESLNPDISDTLQNLRTQLPSGADLTYELSGAPAALDQALNITGYAGRVVVGSWYGSKHATLDLGGRFHRSRIRLISSQVNSLAPEFSGRWTKKRRFEVAWENIQKIKPAHFITHRLPVTEAASAYEMLAHNPAETIQIVFTYPGTPNH